MFCLALHFPHVYITKFERLGGKEIHEGPTENNANML